ncbi:ABC transporter permease [Philodulcilactobacillus myokoensis]|uniref:ABC transporter permease n=1 Tax=Philodulcilactobacillus myokoensis TaxID=2929573 RepID=A0A9W6EU23_9LACO|nr:ABC transporter permease [Philodulcilactobacillus myokoensis]GLB47334.1 ABC transporter permease [Philodulcilactobacillus myokoensis]
MSSDLYREFFKLLHRKVSWFAPLLVLFMMLAMGLSEGKSQPQLLIMTNFASSQVILLALVIVASSIFSMEFQNKAILNVLYRSPNKFQVFFSKLIVIFIYNVALHLITILVTVILSLTPLIDKVSWTSVYQHHQSLLLNMFATVGIDLITSTFIISIIFMISCMINSNAVVVTVNMIIIFMGAYVSYNFLLQNNHNLSGILKWNPFNMVNLTQQYYNNAMASDTKLSIEQLIIATFLYTILFLFAGYAIFRKKRF